MTRLGSAQGAAPASAMAGFIAQAAPVGVGAFAAEFARRRQGPVETVWLSVWREQCVLALGIWGEWSNWLAGTGTICFALGWKVG